ncbi:sigma-70 family RNA polymerase sigma factor [Oceanibaculum indicum]|uniref:RNA polymerase sigma factor n=2 Tax=Oceanibaculum indicum TaxID=526216 RepID=K2JG96_9PROT|nr:sigma-70 family RNA polymerase sigma factor [Oceanibaculum indicum]EKE73597.1 RNA polymerase ECF sigma factor (sigma70) [Oceanibaculum indicum P24]RKQ73930.1 RNA polymerase sigma-70 factor (ECF subfamily) [Oceanibaculum indicum]
MPRHSLSHLLATETDRLRRYARSLVRGREEAEDLVQETLLRGIERSSSWDPSRPLGPWLFSILHNLYASGMRRAQSRERALRHIGLLLEPPRSAPSTPAAQMELNETLRALYDLPEEQRQVLVLVTIEDLSYEEAAARLDIPLGTLMSRLARGREALRQAVDRDEKRPGGLKLVR